MIDRNLLRDEENIQNTRIRGGHDLTLDYLRSLIKTACSNIGLNVTVATDMVNSGRIFDRSTTDCITITNNEHPNDYFIEVITLKTMGIYAMLEFYYTGSSKNHGKMNEGTREHSTLFGTVLGAIQKATVSNDALEEENIYYQMVIDAIKDVLASITVA